MSDALLADWAKSVAYALQDSPRDRGLTRQLRMIARVQNERRKVLDFYAAKYSNR